MIELQDHDNRQHQGIIQLHEENQSFLLLKYFDWENGITVTFRNKTKLVFHFAFKNEISFSDKNILD